MKLLFVGTDKDFGGAQVHFIALATALREAGHEIEVVAAKNARIANELKAAGIDVYPGRFRNTFDPRGYKAVRQRIRKFSPDWIIGGFGRDYWPLLACSRLSGTPLALFRHINRRMKKLSELVVPRVAQRFITVSRAARQMYLDAGIPADCVQISYNPVDTSLFKPDVQAHQRIRVELGIPATAHVVGFSGRMTIGKGIVPLMQACNAAIASNAQLHVLWVGDGPEASRLQEMAQTSGLSAHHHFAGWVSDTAAYYNAFSFLAFPSLSPETFGRVSIEAQACEIPVIGSDVGGVSETMINTETSYLLKPGDISAWRDQILTLCDTDLCQTVGRRARTFVDQHFSHAIVARDFEALLQKKH